MDPTTRPITLINSYRLSREASGWQVEADGGFQDRCSHLRLLIRAIAKRETANDPAGTESLFAKLISDVRRENPRGFLWRVLRTGGGFMILDEIDDALTSYRLWAQPGGPQPLIDDSLFSRGMNRRLPPSPEEIAQGELALRFIAACQNITLGHALPQDIDLDQVPPRPWYVTEIERHDVVHAGDGTHLFSWTNPTGVHAHDRHVAEDCVVLANAYPPTTERLLRARAKMKQRRRALRRLELT